jgi:hypothetical protein
MCDREGKQEGTGEGCLVVYSVADRDRWGEVHISPHVEMYSNSEPLTAGVT